MAGVPGGLGIPTKEERIRSFLQEAAVGDASHDFSGTRSGGDVFNKIYRGQGGNPPFKSIGAPFLEPPSESPSSEFEILNLFLQFQDPKKSLIESFRETFLKDGEPSRTFFRWSEDQNTPYTVMARKVATRPQKDEEGSREYNWLLTPQELYDFMAGANPSLAFTIDATNVPFYDRMIQKTGAAVQKIGTYVYMRESVNDAASKVSIPNVDDADVRIQTVDDTASYNVLYPSIKDTAPAALTALLEQEMFYSDYNLSLSGMGTDQPPAVTLTLYNNAFTQKVQIVKGRKEEAHPNAVPTLAKRILDLAKSLKPGGEEKKKMEYFTALQQKRSGDWLQVLGCLQPERFGLPPSSRIALVSLDKICVAYGLFAGVDVIMTYFLEGRDGADNSYWMIRFQRDFNLPPKSKKDQVRDAILSYPNPLSFASQFPEMTFEKSPACPTLGSLTVTPYTNAKEQYVCQWNGANDALLSQLDKSIKELSDYVGSFQDVPRFSAIESKLQTHIKSILSKAALLALFRSIAFPLDLTKSDESAVYTEMMNPDTWNNAAYNPSERDYATVQSVFTVYKKNYGMLRNILHAKKEKAKSLQEAYQLFFEAIVLKNTAIDRLIQSLSLFGGIFKKDNGGANGVGIFAFLNPYLSQTEAKSLSTVFQKCDAIISDKTKKVQFGQFVEAATTALGQYTQTMSLVPTSDIMESVHAQYEAVHAGGYTQRGGAETDVLEVSDFAPAMAILSKRFREMRGPKGQRLFAQMHSMVQTGSGRATLKKTATRAYSRVSQLRKSKTTKRVLYDDSKHYIHNPFVTFYFLLRELAYRLSLSDDQVEPKDKYYCAILSKLLLQVLTESDRFAKLYSATAKRGHRFAYLYYTSLETYLLEMSMHDSILPVPHSFMKDLVGSYLQGYLAVPPTITGLTILSKGDLTDAFTLIDTHVSKTNQISENLLGMRQLLSKIKEMDAFLTKVSQSGFTARSKPVFGSRMIYRSKSPIRTPPRSPPRTPSPKRTVRVTKPASGKAKSKTKTQRNRFMQRTKSKTLEPVLENAEMLF